MVLLLTVWLLGCADPPCGAIAEPTRAVGEGNVLVVVLDDVGQEALGPWNIGPMPARTPTIDCLCERGVRFTQAWSSPLCGPTRGELLTGRYSRRHDLGANVSPGEVPYELPHNGAGLARMARDAGYRTGFFGKWHVAEPTHLSARVHPNRFGFERFAGSIANLNTTIDGHVRNDYGTWERIVDGVPHEVVSYPTTTTVDDALDFVRQDEAPWLVVLSFHAPHVPLHDPPGGLVGEPVESFNSDHGKFLAMLEAADTELGRFLRRLPSEMLSNTTVVVLGDNGTNIDHIPPALGLVQAKGSVAEAGIRVPIVVSGLGVSAPGVSDALVHVVDVLPTVRDLVQGRVDLPIDGRSWLGALKDPSVEVHSVLYSSQFEQVGGPPLELQRVLRGRGHKWVLDRDGTEHLFKVGPDRIDEGPDLLLGVLSSAEEAELSALRDELASLEGSFAAESGRPVVK